MNVDINAVKSVLTEMKVLNEQSIEKTGYNLETLDVLNDVAVFMDKVKTVTVDGGVVDSTLKVMNVLSDPRNIVVTMDVTDQIRYNGSDISISASFEGENGSFAQSVDFFTDELCDFFHDHVHGKMLHHMNPQLLAFLIGPSSAIDERLMARLIDGTVIIDGVDNQSEVFKNWDVVREQIINCTSDVVFEFEIYEGYDS